MSLTIDPEVFSSIISVIYWSMGISIAAYLAEIVIIATRLGFSKRLTYYWMFGLLAMLIAWVVVYTWRDTVWGLGAIIVTKEAGVEIAKVAMGPYFIAFIVLVLFGLVMCGVTAVAIVRKYAEEIKIIEKVEVEKSTAKDADKYVQVRKERMDSDSGVIKEMKEESKEYKERYKEIKSRW